MRWPWTREIERVRLELIDGINAVAITQEALRLKVAALEGQRAAANKPGDPRCPICGDTISAWQCMAHNSQEKRWYARCNEPACCLIGPLRRTSDAAIDAVCALRYTPETVTYEG